MRHTRAHTANRRSHHALKAVNLSKCTNCGDAHRPHHMCLSCGFYNGRQVMDLTAEKAKRDARIKAKNERIKNEFGAASDTGVAQVAAVAEPKEEKTPKAKKVTAPKAEVVDKEVEKQPESK
jgi:large subunit ribosomal protein L32